MSERRTSRVQLAGGPRDGWVYDVRQHWELNSSREGVVWKPPREITITGWPEPTTIGRYLETGLEENGNLLYEWHPAPPRTPTPDMQPEGERVKG